MKTVLLFFCFGFVVNINAQVTLVKDFNVGDGDSSFSGFYSFKNFLFLKANGKIYKTDGTETGTSELKINNQSITTIDNCFTVDNVMFCRGFYGNNGKILKITENSISEITSSNFNFSSNPTTFARFQGEIYFSMNENFNDQTAQYLFKMNEDGSNITKIKNVFSGTSTGISNHKKATSKYLFFKGKTTANGYELWRTDGTETGTIMVKDINTGTLHGLPANTFKESIVLNDILYFTALDNTNGIELWRSDGTESGTFLVKDLYSGNPGAEPKNFVHFNDEIYFLADLGNRQTLCKTDGTTSGTKAVFNNSSNSSYVYEDELVVFNNELYFIYDGSVNGRELWKSDGTEQGTAIVKDIWEGGSNSNARYITISNNHLFFQAKNSTNINNSNVYYGHELWMTDGTEQGTVLAANINIDDQSSFGDSSYPENLIHHNGYLYFSADDGIIGNELYKFSGATASITNNTINSNKVYYSNRNIYLKGDFENQKIIVKIFNLLGKRMFSKTFSSIEEKRITCNFKRGIYIVSVKSERGTIISKKIIIE